MKMYVPCDNILFYLILPFQNEIANLISARGMSRTER